MAGKSLRLPSSRPIGVRAPLTITELMVVCLRAACHATERWFGQTIAMTDDLDRRLGLVTGVGLLRIDHVGVAVRRPGRGDRVLRPVFGMRCVHMETNEEQGVREAMLAVGPDADGRLRATARAAVAGLDDREVPRPQRARACSRSRTRWPTSTRPARRCASAACGCSTTSPGAARPARGSTSSTPRTPAACWSSWSSRPR